MFDEKQFIDKFVEYYMENTANEYDLSLVFDEYIDDVVAKNSKEVNQFIIATYETIKVHAQFHYDFNVRTSCVLYDTFYPKVESAIDDKYDSDAETDGDFPTEYFD